MGKKISTFYVDIFEICYWMLLQYHFKPTVTNAHRCAPCAAGSSIEGTGHRLRGSIISRDRYIDHLSGDGWIGGKDRG